MHADQRFVGLGSAMPVIKDGRLLALAVVTPQRSPLLPEVPAMVEVLPGWERDRSQAMLAPAGTPCPILNQISKEIARIFDLPDIKERLQTMGYVPSPSTPEEYDKILRAEIEVCSRVARDAGFRAQ